MPFGKLGDGFGSTGGSGGGGTCCGIIVLDTGACSTVRCGVSNTASGTASAALGGYNNSASGQYSGIVAGFCNKATCYGAIVGGGGCNTASNVYAAIVSGNRSTITGSFSFIGSGQANTLSGNYSGILAGKNNNDCGFSNVNIIGSDIRANRACTSYVNDLEIVSLTSCSGCAVCVGTNGLLIGYTSPSLAGFVPYTGATSNVNLGTYSIASLNHIPGYTTTATAAGTTTLTVSSTAEQYFTGTTTQTVVLPVATTLVNGQQFTIVNNSTGVVTVQSSGLNTLQAMAAGTQLVLTMINTAGGTGTASWSWAYSYLASSVSTFSAGTTGFTPNTATGGAVTLAGTLAIANGGTNVTSVTVAPTATAFAGWDANKNLSANSLINGYATTATAAGTTTLFVGSAAQQYFTGSTTQTVVLPVATTLVNGQQFTITNNSTGVVTVQSSGLNTLQAMAAGTELIATLINTAGGTGTASWSWTYAPLNISAAAVTTFSAGTTGFTPNTATSGSIVLAGTLNVANGGTGVTTLAALASNSAFSSLYQGLNTNLTSLSGLTYASLSFVKMTAAGTFALDTNTYLTGNQTITLSSDVTGSGTTAITATISANAVTYAKFQQMAANTLHGNPTGSLANSQEITLGTGLSFSTTVLNLSTNLQSLSGLTYASTSFVKMTAAGTFALDTNTYLTSGTGVTTFSGGTTGLTPSSATSGAITLAGTLVAANGGTGYTSLASLAGDAAFTSAFQAKATNLTSLAGLSYASTSFVKMTAAGTFALDVNTYLTTSSASSTYLPLTGGTTTGNITSNVSNAAITVKAVGSTDAVYYDARNSAGTELFYLGLLNTSNYNVALMNEQAGSLSFGTTNGTRYTIDSSGNNTWTGSGTFGGSLTAGAISSSVSSGNNINLDKSGGAAINFTRSGVQHFLMEDDANGIGFYYGSSPTLGTTIGQNITTGGSVTGAAASFTTGAFSVSGGTNQITLQTSGTDRAYIQANTANLIINSITSNPLLLQTNGTTALTINSSQNATFSGTVTATAGYNSSDKLLKNEVIRDLSDWRISNKISTVGYTWKDPKKGLGLRFGYYAQDLLPLIPEAVTKGDDGYYAVDYTMVHTVILDEHTIRIKQLEQEVASLKRRLGE